MPRRGSGSYRRDGWTLYGQAQEEEAAKYRQIWYDKNVWNAPEVQNAATREERECGSGEAHCLLMQNLRISCLAYVSKLKSLISRAKR